VLRISKNPNFSCNFFFLGWELGCRSTLFLCIGLWQILWMLCNSQLWPSFCSRCNTNLIGAMAAVMQHSCHCTEISMNEYIRLKGGKPLDDRWSKFIAEVCLCPFYCHIHTHMTSSIAFCWEFIETCNIICMMEKNINKKRFIKSLCFCKANFAI